MRFQEFLHYFTQKVFTIKVKLISLFFSGKPLEFANVFTAFGVALLGITISLVLFIIELVTAAFGCCKKMMNVYNYRIDTKPNPDNVPSHSNVDKVSRIEIPNPW